MGIFQKKQTQEEVDGPLHFFDEYFRDELRRRGREYFEKVIDDNATLFKKDLDTTIQGINSELKSHITDQLDGTVAQVNAKITEQINEQFVEYGKEIKDAQDASLKSLTTRAQALEGQYQEFSKHIEKSITDQEAKLDKIFEQKSAQLATMQQAQEAAVQSLQKSVEAMEQQYLQLNEVLQKRVVEQEAIMLNLFEQNMAQIVEHYLLEALGDQYDLKAQLPAIIKQMEANKQTIVDDMKL